jgi:hypothetical protein
MFISTREMLGQIAPSRALAEEVIEKCYGPNCDWSKISGDLAIRSTLEKLGLDAFSDGALQQIVFALTRQQLPSAEITADHL